ncbi:MAG: DsbA family oxidoreductase [Actinomycetota bacterium]|nr:MAG: DsbA family oxidoreductase [Actinomycetota bacterium]
MMIDFYADILCPWCYIGHRRLRSALRDAPSSAVIVRWRSVELSPGLSRVPADTAAQQMAAATWWGDQAAARIADIRSLGSAEGLQLNLHVARPVNSFDAHRLVKFAAHHGRQGDIVEGLLYGYHTEGVNIADHGALEEIGTRAGLGGNDIRSLLAGDAFAAEVRTDERSARQRGVSGVPSLVLGDGPPLTGLHSTVFLRQLIHQAVTDAGDALTRDENP